MTRYLERIDRVFDAVAKAEGGSDMVGFCLDTCHAHAGGNALETVVEDVLKVTGRIDLVHCQRQPRRVRLRRRPARQLRRRPDRPRPAGGGGPRRRRPRRSARPPEGRPSTSPTSPSSGSACDAAAPDALLSPATSSAVATRPVERLDTVTALTRSPRRRKKPRTWGLGARLLVSEPQASRRGRRAGPPAPRRPTVPPAARPRGRHRRSLGDPCQQRQVVVARTGDADHELGRLAVPVHRRS